jgi:hypothetical protein
MTDPALQGISEREFQDKWVIPAAMKLGWAPYHTHDSRRSFPGFPDLILIRKNRMVVAELKSEKGQLTADQRMWLRLFEGVAEKSENITVHLWRPSDWDEVVATLNDRSR